jgi:hypothetical protein
MTLARVCRRDLLDGMYGDLDKRFTASQVMAYLSHHSAAHAVDGLFTRIVSDESINQYAHEWTTQTALRTRVSLG